MSDYIVYTDSACDISPEILDQWGVKYLSLTFRFEGDDREYSNSEMPAEPFYARMRAGAVAKTSAINVESFKGAFEAELRAGNDILYIGFSSGLSNTVNAAQIAANELLAEYPERKLIVVDTLCGLRHAFVPDAEAQGRGRDHRGGRPVCPRHAPASVPLVHGG